MVEVGEWHYNRVPEGRLDNGFADPSGCVVDAQGIVDGLLGGFGAGGFAHVQGASVGAAARHRRAPASSGMPGIACATA